ncbi:MAG: site-specific integrase, partial [Pseudomonadota bacterium]
ELIHRDGAVGIIKDFCASKGIEIPQGADARTNLLEEYRKGYLAFTEEALRHSAELSTMALHEPATVDQSAAAASFETEDEAPQTAAFEEVAEQYFEEKLRGRALAPKTETEKRDALQLLSELTGRKPLSELTKQDAQKVKSALLKLPKHRNTNPRTRGKPLAEILTMADLERMSSRTVNAYLGHMQSLFTWAVDNGYADSNVFNGLRIKASRRAQSDGRQAFTAEQLQRMFAELTDPNSSLVNKDMHRWVTLIGMFTGMRLNEIAQLEKSDIRSCDGVLCIDINEDGDDRKSLKNTASKRLVPVHDTLLELGIEAFVERRQSYSRSRLFHELTYSPQNGYGRNAGRWFNEQFVPKLEFGERGLVFHCLRHTMVTRLAQAGVDETVVKALLGHTQSGVTLNTYFKEGFLATQLHSSINRFAF